MNLWCNTSPTNIALIKYMGKTGTGNQPANPSLSYTTPRFTSTVELSLTNAIEDQWQPLDDSIQLTSTQQQRFLKHLQWLKSQANCQQNFLLRSTNNFAANCGLASSASSFAALTRCAMDAFSNLCPHYTIPDIKQQAALSQRGSGSSCRSFLEPWVLWDEQGVQALVTAYPKLEHRVIVVNQNSKLIPSSEAHKRVSSSSLYAKRTQRVTVRLQQLTQALISSDWPMAYQMVWQDFWDMHFLFETSQPPFGYINDDSIRALKVVTEFWKEMDDGPLITMDAGPNIHLLFRSDQTELLEQLSQQIQQQFLLL